MLFNSLAFCVFLPISLLLFRVIHERASRYVLLLASYLFYAAWDWRFLGLILASTVVDFSAGIALERATNHRYRKRVLLGSISFNLGLLAFFKYFNFFLGSLAELLKGLGVEALLPSLHIVLPVGISFYTFQTMSYTIDVWRQTIKPERDFITFATFVAFFPQLVAGPIERASSLLPQLKTRIPCSTKERRQAAWLILWGFYLKVFMADNLGPIVDSIYQNLGTRSGTEILVAHYAFAFQILGDFAGYSSIAIGIALLFGIRLNRNFAFPYFVTTPSQFWRHWHISLSNWLRDYLYIPLGGSRANSIVVYRNLIATMLLGGLWHGAAWNFVLWGLFHGLLLAVFRASSDTALSQKLMTLPRPLKIIAMFHLTCIGWMLFRVPDLASIGIIIHRSLVNPLLSDWQTLHWFLLSLFHIAPTLWILSKQYQSKETDGNPFPDRPIFIFFLVMTIILFGEWGTKSFIYFQF